MCKATTQEHTHPDRAPTAKPPFTIGTLRSAIPKHCFERDTWRSLAYLLVDLVILAVLYAASTYFKHLPIWTAYILWPVYWFTSGAVATGVWVIAHECGHGAFSKYTIVNDLVGLTTHSFLLVPYFSWKHSHRRHHSNTGSIDRDEVFVPSVRSASEIDHDFEFSQLPIVRLAYLVSAQVFGWPLYLWTNATGNKSYTGWVNHFNPYSPIFTKRERIEVFISDLALAGVLYLLVSAGTAFGWLWLIRVYVIPYLIVNHWLVMITLLQHTHPSLAHYGDKEWDWLRGALSTVDRTYGFLDVVFHHIADTHVCHHLFSQIPHYHAQEATEAIKPILGKYYMFDGRPVFQAMWRDNGKTRFVAPDSDDQQVYWYRK